MRSVVNSPTRNINRVVLDIPYCGPGEPKKPVKLPLHRLFGWQILPLAPAQLGAGVDDEYCCWLGNATRKPEESRLSELKTRPSGRSVRAFLDSVSSVQRRADALRLLDLFEAVTGERGVLWGSSIIGFGRYRYRQKSGRPGEWPLTGFSPRKQALVIYVMPGFESYEGLLRKLGKHRTGKSCLYISRLDQVDISVLHELVKDSIARMQSLYDCS